MRGTKIAIMEHELWTFEILEVYALVHYSSVTYLMRKSVDLVFLNRYIRITILMTNIEIDDQLLVTFDFVSTGWHGHADTAQLEVNESLILVIEKYICIQGKQE